MIGWGYAVAGLIVAFIGVAGPVGAQQRLAGWAPDVFENIGPWSVVCETHVGTGKKRCYLQRAEPYHPRPDFRSAVLFITIEEEREMLAVGVEPQARVADTIFAVDLPAPAPRVSEAADGTIARLMKGRERFEIREAGWRCAAEYCTLPPGLSDRLIDRMDRPGATLRWTMRALPGLGPTAGIEIGNDDRPTLIWDLAEFRQALARFREVRRQR
ncbi:MAG: hypothetical protein AAFV62_03225 [Pseudomonadota bacterium]